MVSTALQHIVCLYCCDEKTTCKGLTYTAAISGPTVTATRRWRGADRRVSPAGNET